MSRVAALYGAADTLRPLTAATVGKRATGVKEYFLNNTFDALGCAFTMAQAKPATSLKNHRKRAAWNAETVVRQPAGRSSNSPDVTLLHG